VVDSQSQRRFLIWIMRPSITQNGSEQMCYDAGVKLVTPYSPDLNLIEEFFAELKAELAIL